MLLYFSDETGDPGTGVGASRHFGVCLLRVEPEEARRITRSLRQVRDTMGLPFGHEFKWSRNHPETRMAALIAASRHDFGFRARLWEKSVSASNIMPGKELEVQLIRACLRDFGPPWPPAKLYVDGLRSRERAARIRKGLVDQLDPFGRPCIREVRLQDSASSDLLQLADLIAGWSVGQTEDVASVGEVKRALSLRGTCSLWP